MAKYHRILVAVDGSESSLHALQEAFKLTASWITVVAVAPPYEGDLRMVGASHMEELIREPCTTALTAAQDLGAAAGAVIKTGCEVGEPYERIVARAETALCDLIVIGAKGRSFLERLMVGSVSRRVIGYTDKDVLVVPLGASVGWDKILVATDGSLDSLAAAARALDLAEAYGSKLTVLSVVDFPTRLSGQSQKLVDGIHQAHRKLVVDVTKPALAAQVQAEGIVREGKPYQVIADTARDQKANLIVMGSHGRTGLKRLLMGSVTERVIGHAPCPVLVVKG